MNKDRLIFLAVVVALVGCRPADPTPSVTLSPNTVTNARDRVAQTGEIGIISAAAFGFDDVKQTYTRIRVDQSGAVRCQ